MAAVTRELLLIIVLTPAQVQAEFPGLPIDAEDTGYQDNEAAAGDSLDPTIPGLTWPRGDVSTVTRCPSSTPQVCSTEVYRATGPLGPASPWTSSTPRGRPKPSSGGESKTSSMAL